MLHITHLLPTLGDFSNVPLLPESKKFDHIKTGRKLVKRSAEVYFTAKWHYNHKYTINGKTHTSYHFMYGTILPSDSHKLSLETAKDFEMSWTNYDNIRTENKPFLDKFAATLENIDDANREFWPTIAKGGLPYNLLILQKLKSDHLSEIKTLFGEMWNDDWDNLVKEELLYFIDMRIFDILKPSKVNGFTRFTPSTVTLLQQNQKTRELAPIAVHVSRSGETSYNYTPSSKTWLYALQAAKTSITVFGIWLGHVYHWHIISAAVLDIMNKELSPSNPIHKLVSPQSNYLIAFNNFLFHKWKDIAPPTSLDTKEQFIELINKYAQERSFFDDDPKATLQRFGIAEKDFTCNKPWDQYPIVASLIEIWDAVEEYIDTFVDTTYNDDSDIIEDKQLQKWIQETSSLDGGNIQGLTSGIKTKNDLKSFLSSLIYRLTVHGTSRLRSSSNPYLTFVGNFPPCLQISDLPSPDKDMSTKELLTYLPKTGTIGEMMTFYNTFAFSSPYEPFIPDEGIDTKLHFSDDSDPRNVALIKFRTAIKNIIEKNSSKKDQIGQWPLNIET